MQPGGYGMLQGVSSLCGAGGSSDVEGLPVPQSALEDESECVAYAALIEGIAEVGEVLEVCYPVARGLLPSGLSGEH